MNGLLNLDSPIVTPSFCGGWIVDDGSMPFRVSDRHAAQAEAVARTPSAPASAIPVASGGTAPESPVTSPRDTDSGTTSCSRAAVVVGATARVHPSENGALT